MVVILLQVNVHMTFVEEGLKILIKNLNVEIIFFNKTTLI